MNRSLFLLTLVFLPYLSMGQITDSINKEEVLAKIEMLNDSADLVTTTDMNKAVTLLEEISDLAKKHNFSKIYFSNQAKLAHFYTLLADVIKAYDYGIEALNSQLLDQEEFWTTLQIACKSARTQNLDTTANLYNYGYTKLDEFFPSPWTESDSILIAGFYRSFGTYKRNLGQNLEALELYQKAYTTFPGKEMYNLPKFNNLCQMIILFQRIGDKENADLYIKEGRALADLQKMEVSRGKSYSVLSRFYLKQGEREKAKAMAEKAIALLENTYYKKELVFAYKVMINWGIETGDLAISKLYLDLTKEHLPQLNNISLQINFKLIEARYLIEKTKFSAAKEIVLEVLQYEPIKQRPLEIQMANRLLAQAEFGLGNTRKAFQYLEDHHRIKDSIFLNKQNQFVLDANARYKKREQELAITQLELTNSEKETELIKNNRTIIIGSIGLFAMTLFGGVIFSFYRSKQKAAKALAEKNNIISVSLAEKELLLKEIHHRVKNNLQVISSLLYLQSDYIKDEKALSAIQEGRDRVKSMAIIHQNLYQEDNLTGIQVKDYFEKLTRSLFDSYNVRTGQIELQLDIEAINLDVDTVIPLGLIVNELITNSLKYAFPKDRKGCIKITLQVSVDELILEVADDGVGFDVSGINEGGDSFGYQIIHAFKDKLEADLSVTASKGTQVRLAIHDYQLAS